MEKKDGKWVLYEFNGRRKTRWVKISDSPGKLLPDKRLKDDTTLVPAPKQDQGGLSDPKKVVAKKKKNEKIPPTITQSGPLKPGEADPICGFTDPKKIAEYKAGLDRILHKFTCGQNGCRKKLCGKLFWSFYRAKNTPALEVLAYGNKPRGRHYWTV